MKMTTSDWWLLGSGVVYIAWIVAVCFGWVM